MSATMSHFLSKLVRIRLWALSAPGRFWVWIGTSKDQLAILFAVAAGLTTLHQYRDKVADDRRKESLTYVERYQQDRIAKARSEISKTLFEPSAYQTYLDADIRASKGDTKPLEKFVADKGLQPHIMTLVEVYIDLGACVEAKVCDDTIACRFFRADIDALNNSFRKLFDTTWKAMWGENYMDDPMRFVKQCPRAASQPVLPASSQAASGPARSSSRP